MQVVKEVIFHWDNHVDNYLKSSERSRKSLVREIFKIILTLIWKHKMYFFSTKIFSVIICLVDSGGLTGKHKNGLMEFAGSSLGLSAKAYCVYYSHRPLRLGKK